MLDTFIGNENLIQNLLSMNKSTLRRRDKSRENHLKTARLDCGKKFLNTSIKLIGQKSFILFAPDFLGIRAMNDAPNWRDDLPLNWKMLHKCNNVLLNCLLKNGERNLFGSLFSFQIKYGSSGLPFLKCFFQLLSLFQSNMREFQVTKIWPIPLLSTIKRDEVCD